MPETITRVAAGTTGNPSAYTTPDATAATSATAAVTKRRSGHARVRTPAIPLDMPGRYSTGNVLAVTGWSASTLWNRIRDKRFPKPQYDGRRAWWPTSVVREALGL